MKKIINTMLICAAIMSASNAAFAEEPVVTSASLDSSYSIMIDNAKLDLGESKFCESGKQLMIPLRAVAEKLGFKVTWDAEHQGIALDNGEVNTIVYIGEDNYYMASSTAIGMSAPTALGAAPILKNGTTYVPAEMFNILNCGEIYSVKDNVISFKADGTAQIPNPIVEYKSIEAAKKELSFNAPVPSKMPEGYELKYIETISGDVFQLVYTNGKNEICYRAAEGSEDISGDYNVYKDIKKVNAGGIEVELRNNKDTASAIWQKAGMTFSLFSYDELSENDIITIVSGIL